ncbi:hypothetical protein D6C90_06826 [Aureobasidium pullulans]|uniref:Peroxin 11C n=1 Tax=Aureobasidium pullulans TaxID=5580 RepID=A0A4S9UHS2_AURPU|nr:hypothetical protein D6C90_06826 [Aureobasidium pullulans]
MPPLSLLQSPKHRSFLYMATNMSQMNLNNVARLLASRSDSMLDRLIRVMSTSAGRDKTLCTLQYLLIIVYTQLSRLQGLRYRRLLLSVSRKLGAVMLPGETVVATLSPPDDKLSHVIAGSKALSELISDFRCFTRVFVETLDLYTWGKSTWNNPPKDGLIKTAVWGQIWTITLYQWYENVAYLASKGVLRGERFNTKQQNKWWVWSSRYWMAYIALEAVRLARVWQLKPTITSSDDSAATKAETQAAEALWKRQMTVNLAWAPVSYHYSLESGALSNDWLGVLGLIAGATGFRNLWKQAGEA